MVDQVPAYQRMDRAEGRTLLVRGDLDLATAEDLRREVLAVLGEANSPAFVDLSGVTFFDSSSVAVLVAADQMAPELGSELVIVSPSPACRRVFDLLGLAAELDIRDDPGEPLAY